MSVERPYYISPIEQELYFAQWAQENGIKRFLFDCDDTICATGKVFREFKSQAVNFLATVQPTLNQDQWKKELETVDNMSFEKHGVCSDRWNMVTEELGDKYNLDLETRQTTKDTFQKMFNTPLEMLEGSEKTLEFITKIGIPIGIVTHASREWTWKKYNWLNLQRFLNWDDVFVINENGHKTHESWQDAIKYFHLNPEDCAVIGDSPRSDINPAQKAGVKHCFLVENTHPWSVHQQPIHPDIRVIKNLSQLIEIGTGKL